MAFQVLVKPWPSSAILVSSRRCKLAIATLKPGRSGEAWFTRLCRAMVVEDLPSGRYLSFERCTGYLSAFLLLTVTFAHFGLSMESLGTTADHENGKGQPKFVYTRTRKPNHTILTAVSFIANAV